MSARAYDLRHKYNIWNQNNSTNPMLQHIIHLAHVCKQEITLCLPLQSMRATSSMDCEISQPIQWWPCSVNQSLTLRPSAEGRAVCLTVSCKSSYRPLPSLSSSSHTQGVSSPRSHDKSFIISLKNNSTSNSSCSLQVLF